MARTAEASASATSRASPATATALLIAVVVEQRPQLVLEAAGLDRAVDAALLRRVLLPPPAPRTGGFARRDGARARRAADRRVAAVVERVVGQLALAHVLPDLVLGPLGERVQLDDRAVVVVELDLPDVAARGPLVAPQARDPGVEAGQVARQRLHLPDLAAQEPVLD